MDRINSLIVRLQNRRQEGQAMVEYGLILGLVSVAAIVILGTIGGQVDGVLTAVSTGLGTVPGA